MAANENSILGHLRENNPVLFEKIENAFALGKKLDFGSIKQKDVIMTSPQKAFEYAGEEGDKYFKVWMVGNKIAWCTWANTMIDGKFRWNTKARNEEKRDNDDIIGNEPYISAYLKSNSAIEQCTTVYMFPFSKFLDIRDLKMKRGPQVSKRHPNKTNSNAGKLNRAADWWNNIGKEEEEEKKAALKKIDAIDLDDQDTKKLVKTLLDLSTKIDVKAGEQIDGDEYKSLKAKFDSGIMLLKSIDPDNPILPSFENKQKEWAEKQKRSTIMLFIMIGAMLAIGLIVCLIEKL